MNTYEFKTVSLIPLDGIPVLSIRDSLANECTALNYAVGDTYESEVWSCNYELIVGIMSILAVSMKKEMGREDKHNFASHSKQEVTSVKTQQREKEKISLPHWWGSCIPIVPAAFLYNW